MKTISTTLIACLLGCVAHGPVAQASTETVLYSFCSQANCTDGAVPKGALVSVNGVLYGTTKEGGGGGCNAPGCGTVFSLNPKTHALTVIYSFGGGADGSNPLAAVISVRGTLYGTTAGGGDGGVGTVYSLNQASGGEAVLYAFKGGNDGAFPFDSLLSVGSTLYGTTMKGGTNNVGTVFSLNTTTDAEKVLHSFQNDGTDGEFLLSNLIDIGGILFGTASGGGPYLGGTVFLLDPTLDAEAVVYAFGRSGDGAGPDAGLINVNGTLYGTTKAGGADGQGTLFSFDLNTGVENVLYSFCSHAACTDGGTPVAGVINVKGTLYGTTKVGGGYDGGTVFSFNPTNGVEAVLHSFGTGADGANPVAGVIDAGGKLYGTTVAGGASGYGTVFEIVP